MKPDPEYPQPWRKKPVVIDACGPVNHKNARHIAAWCGGTAIGHGEAVVIETLEGTMRADAGDFVIRGVKGEFYPIKPDIFAETYELVEEEPTPAQPWRMSDEDFERFGEAMRRGYGLGTGTAIVFRDEVVELAVRLGIVKPCEAEPGEREAVPSEWVLNHDFSLIHDPGFQFFILNWGCKGLRGSNDAFACAGCQEDFLALRGG